MMFAEHKHGMDCSDAKAQPEIQSLLRESTHVEEAEIKSHETNRINGETETRAYFHRAILPSYSTIEIRSWNILLVI